MQLLDFVVSRNEPKHEAMLNENPAGSGTIMNLNLILLNNCPVKIGQHTGKLLEK